MAKKIDGYIKLQIPAGKANPSPPIGPALGQRGLNIMEFIKTFNERTAAQVGLIIPVVITVYEDRTFSFVCKVPPMAELIKKAINLEKGSGVPNRDKVGNISRAKIREIAAQKMPDLNAANLEAAARMVAGTARSMGVTIED